MLRLHELQRFEARRKARIRAELNDQKQAKLCMAEVKQSLARLRRARDPVRREPTVDAVIRVVCELMQVTSQEFRGHGRHPRVVFARWLAAALCRDMTPASFPDIARAMGRPTHSTIIAMVRRLPGVFSEPIDHDSDAPTVGEMYRRCRAAVLATREEAA